MAARRVTARVAARPRFLYRRLADVLRRDIESGALEPGDMLPSLEALAAIHRVNKGTVRQAIRELITEGWVYTVPARGTFVADRSAGPPEAARRTLTIGWISAVNDRGNTGRYHTELMDAVRASVQDAGGHLLVLSAEGFAPDAFCRRVNEARLDGGVLVGPSRQEPLRSILRSGLPAVVLDDPHRGHVADTLIADYETGGYLAVEHLARLGHRRFAFVTGPLSWEVCQRRLRGARTALRDAGLDPAQAEVLESDFSPQGGYAAALKMLRRGRLPTGLFCFNDEMAAGVLRALYDRSALRVPDDLSVVGFDNVSWTEYIHPPLTTIHVEKELMGRLAVERLLGQIEARRRKAAGAQRAPAALVVTPVTLVVRKSTGPPPRGRHRGEDL